MYVNFFFVRVCVYSSSLSSEFWAIFPIHFAILTGWIMYIYSKNKGVSFLRHYGAASVGEYNKVIWYY